MRFIVDFYRYAILAFFALVVAAFVLLFIALVNGGSAPTETILPVAVAGLAVLTLMTLSVGLIATFISIHDRHIELVEELRLMREQLEEKGST